MPLVTQAKPPCMHGTHAHNCKSGVGAHNAPQASPVVSHKSSDPVAKASSVVDVHDKSTAVQGQSVQGSVAKSSTQAYNAAQTCLPTTLSAPSPQVASGVMVPTIRHECAYNTALELHEASVASRIAALGREIEALDIQGRCVVQVCAHAPSFYSAGRFGSSCRFPFWSFCSISKICGVISCRACSVRRCLCFCTPCMRLFSIRTASSVALLRQ